MKATAPGQRFKGADGAVEDYEFAVAVLHQSGFKLMYQDDLSR